jgi:hypothetical protein
MLHAARGRVAGAQPLAADQLDKFLGLFLAPTALHDEHLDARFDDARHAAIGQAFGRNEVALIDGAKYWLAGVQVGDHSPSLEGLASLWHVLCRDNDSLGLVLRCLRRH